jgi:hypothetical protein
VLPALVLLVLAVFAGALWWSPLAGRAAWLHLMLAAGAMPLIFAAMGHFIPVLTRSRAAPGGLAALPAAALAGGALAVAAFGFSGAIAAWQAGVLLALAATVALLAWSRRRRASMLGTPHPCLAWYDAALGALALALLAILAAAAWPQHFAALRSVHLHLNTLGFIGLTALGTLAVLLPTVAGRPDAEAARRLRRELAWAVAGTLLVAAGAAWAPPLAWLGLVLWTLAVLRLGSAWLRAYRREIFARHGALPLLAAAVAGFAVSLLLGAASAVAAGRGVADPAAAFAVGFLLPLVSGAASQLLPVWLRPGVQSAWHAALRERLARHGGTRALLFVVAGIAAGLGATWGPLLGAAALSWFLLQAAAALTRAGARGG